LPPSSKALEPPLHLSNAFFVADRLSCVSDPGALAAPAKERVYRDAYFGNTWSWTPPPGAAVYGKTDDMPPTPIEALGSGDYLRVPYRRIPVIDIRSASELMDMAASVHSQNPDIRGVWRGQARHYNLLRSEDDLLRLYGDAAAQEPSLLPSASRSDRYFPDLFPTWAGLIDLFLGVRTQALGETFFSQRDRIRDEARNFSATYNYRLWGFATAQHYGLPSVGLDVTHDMRVALFFALHRFSTDRSTGAMSMTRATDADSPIIYAMGGFQHDLFDDEKLGPAWLQCARPKAQGAMFFGTGWGQAANKAADRIYMALRLVNHSHWTSPFKGYEIFPSPAEDPFLAFLLDARDRYDIPAVKEILAQIYFLP
jgi:hypothetical protein